MQARLSQITDWQIHYPLKKLFVTGSSGLIGSQVAVFFCEGGWAVHGVDNNMRRDFFGPRGTRPGTESG